MRRNIKTYFGAQYICPCEVQIFILYGRLQKMIMLDFLNCNNSLGSACEAKFCKWKQLFWSDFDSATYISYSEPRYLEAHKNLWGRIHEKT